MPALMTAGRWNNRKTSAHYTEREAANGRSAQLLQGRPIGKEAQATNKEGTMTAEEQQLLEQYLTHLNVLGPEGSYPGFEAWYQEVRPLCPRPKHPKNRGGGLGAALQGHPRRHPGLQPAAREPRTCVTTSQV